MASSAPFFGIARDEAVHHSQLKAQLSSSTPSSSSAAPPPAAPPPPPPTQKKKRNLPGNPNPDAEVIALSPKTLMATNRFICEVCNKGFQREQNLQLHRRGHNLPWKLKQKNSKEAQRRKVYLCPEPTCVHHDPSRALGDLTGIKKHFCRKHGEKKWKCDKCSKRYAVQSDWKAHSKTCGTREYRCDCGTLFSRRDSFITHRAFCDALAQESARLPTGLSALGSHLYGNSSMGLGLSQMSSQLSSLQEQTHPSADLLRLGAGGGRGSQFDHHLMPPSNNHSSFRQPHPLYLGGNSNQDFHDESQTHHSMLQGKPFHGLMQLPDFQSNANPNPPSSAATAAANLFNLSFFSNSSSTSTMNNGNSAGNQNSHLPVSDHQFNTANGSGEPVTLFSGSLMGEHLGGAGVSSLYNSSVQNEPLLPEMSATALLQKAAQMGATTSNNASSLLRGFGSSPSNGTKQTSARAGFGSGGNADNMRTQMENESHLQDLMNSLANGSSGMFVGSGGGVTPFGGNCTGAGRHEQEASTFGEFNPGLCNMDEGKLQASMSARSMGASDTLTRDFLGVGSMVRGMGGGIAQREQHRGIDMGSLDSDMKRAPSGRPFAGGHLQ